MSDIAYPVLTQIEGVVEEGVDIVSDAALAAILVDVPWLNLPIIKQVFTGIWHMCLSYFFKKFRLVVDLSAIKLVNTVHLMEMDREGTKLMLLARNYGVESEQFKKQKEVYREKFKTFVRYGATLPSV